jgi:hypothetical protein
VKDLIIVGMSRAFIKESSFQNVHQKKYLLDKAIVKVVNIKKNLASKICLWGLGSVREKKLFGKKFNWQGKFFLQKN